MIENVRISEKAKNQLITLKRRTGIQNWNVLCRWALCLSLREVTPPPLENVIADSSVEMTWRTFTGGLENLYLALIVARAKKDGVPLERVELNNYFKLHLHRGISYLNGSDTEGLNRLLKLAIVKSR
jgi:DNA sulfur modification protein DndE